MDVGTLGAISTVLVTIAFLGVCFWAFSPKLKKRFEEDAKLPFADEIDNKQTDHQK
jgi:cytochrome c oxidase cbb3-type subunit IV